MYHLLGLVLFHLQEPSVFFAYSLSQKPEMKNKIRRKNYQQRFKLLKHNKIRVFGFPFSQYIAKDLQAAYELNNFVVDGFFQLLRAQQLVDY